MSVTPSATPKKRHMDTLKLLLPYLGKHKLLLILGTFSVLATVVLSFGIGIGIQWVIDEFPEDATSASGFLDQVLYGAIAIIIGLAGFGFTAGYSLRKLATLVTQDMRCDIFENILHRDFDYIENQASGDIQTRIVADTDAVGNFLSQQAPLILTAVLSLIVGIVSAIYISLKLTLLVLAFLPFIFTPLIVLNSKLHGLGTDIQNAISGIGRYAGEIFRNIKVIRAYNNEKIEGNRFSQLTGVAVNNILKTARLELGLGTIVEALVLLALSVLIWSAANDIMTGKMTTGELVGFAYFSIFIVRSGAGLLRIAAAINVAFGTASKVVEYLSVEKHAWPSEVDNLRASGDIEFNAVYFSYPNRPDTEVLYELDMTIPGNSQVAIVGSSGAGKSTLFELLLRFYEPDEGEILLDGQNIAHLNTHDLRRSIGYVPQKESLISGTVYDNIAYGSHNTDLEQVRQAAELAHANEFIDALPNGYDTDLGEVGGRLSGGQKQRLALARALVRKPHILLLDEANSALDNQSEQFVTAAIEQWAKQHNSTVISIAHRLSTVKNADVIFVMDDGAVVASGTHESLLQESPLYQKLSAEVLEPEAPQVQNTDGDTQPESHNNQQEIQPVF